MKLIYVLIILILFNNCSFDSKSGIWKNENVISKKDDNIFEEFETLSSPTDSFEKIVSINDNYKFKLPSPITNSDWKDIYFDKTNNLKNFRYSNVNKLIFKSKKISKYKINNFLFEDNNIIAVDIKGNVITYSIDNNNVISKFNFYNKKYKKIDKILNFIVEDNIIYISDNIGYLYAFNYIKNNILWAKNYKIPFRSNLKLVKDKLVAANQNNDLYFFDKNNGNIKKLIPTEETVIKNKFVNNLSLYKENIYFLNTYGSLYAINNQTNNMKWFLNLNRSLDLNPNNLFFGNQIVIDGNRAVVTSSKFTYVLNAINGTIVYKKNYSSDLRPIIINDYLFLITNKNLLIAMELNSGDLIYSYDISQKIADHLNTKKKEIQIKSFMIVNNNIFIFLKNSYVLKFDIKGNLETVNKLPSKLNISPIFINNSMLLLNSKNKISIIN